MGDDGEAGKQGGPTSSRISLVARARRAVPGTHNGSQGGMEWRVLLLVISALGVLATVCCLLTGYLILAGRLFLATLLILGVLLLQAVLQDD